LTHASAGRGYFFCCGGGSCGGGSCGGGALGIGQLEAQDASAARYFSPHVVMHLAEAAASCPRGHAWEHESTAAVAFRRHSCLHCSGSFCFGAAAAAGSASSNPPITAAHHHEALFTRFMARISSR
jgi:hypothetical protein